MIDEELRSGGSGTLFMISGAGGAAEELARLARLLGGDSRIVALVPAPAPGEDEATTTVETMATAAVALMRLHQPHGPYRLLGYSLGGILALEAGRLLREAGEAVSFLGLVDPVFDQRYWPGLLFVRASARRAAVHARELLRKPPLEASLELSERAGRLSRRLRSRFGAERVDNAPARLTLQETNLAIMAGWRPRVFDGPIVLFTAADSDFGVDVATLWRPWLPGMKVRTVNGNHLEIVQGNAIGRLARAVDEALDECDSPRLRVLIATTFDWSAAARLAVELDEVGCIVKGVAPKGSALHKIAAVKKSYELGLINAAGSLRHAIESSRADLIIPFDDRTRQAMHRLHAEADPSTSPGARLRAQLERSLGPAALYSDLYSRVAMMDTAAECGVRCPPTAAINSPADIRQWLADHPGPAVLKTDGSWGGRETRVIHTSADVPKAWRHLSRPPGLARCLKRALVEHDPWPLRARLTGYRPRLSIQAFVEGDPGNAAVACLDGELLGAVQAEVIRGNGPTGPSTVLRIVEHPEMLGAARAMVSRLQLSGLVGLDFILERGTGQAHLIELNPRATPTCHLISAEGVDLAASLRSALGYPGSLPRTASYPGGLVALFPEELRRDPSGEILNNAYHDVPWHAPDLLAHELAGLRASGTIAAGWTPDPSTKDVVTRPGQRIRHGHQAVLRVSRPAHPEPARRTPERAALEDL